MKLTHTIYSDFVIWTPNEFVVLRVDLDIHFITKAFQEATLFTAGILPKLVGKWYTKAPVYSHEPVITEDVEVSDSPVAIADSSETDATTEKVMKIGAIVGERMKER